MLHECGYMNDEASKSADNPWVADAGTNQDPTLVWAFLSSASIRPMNIITREGCRARNEGWMGVGWEKNLFIGEKRVDGGGGGGGGVRRGQGGGFCGRASRPTHRWLITTHNAKHTAYSTQQNDAKNYTKQYVLNYNHARPLVLQMNCVCFRGV